VLRWTINRVHPDSETSISEREIELIAQITGVTEHEVVRATRTDAPTVHRPVAATGTSRAGPKRVTREQQTLQRARAAAAATRVVQILVVLTFGALALTVLTFAFTSGTDAPFMFSAFEWMGISIAVGLSLIAALLIPGPIIKL
jgi:hypothetical protein